MKAAESGNTDTVRIILEHGADVNAKDVYGKLHILSQYLYIHKPIKLSLCICEYHLNYQIQKDPQKSIF